VIIDRCTAIAYPIANQCDCRVCFGECAGPRSGRHVCIPAPINSVASIPAVPALRTRRMESSRSVSSPPTTQSSGGRPARSGEARGCLGSAPCTYCPPFPADRRGCIRCRLRLRKRHRDLFRVALEQGPEFLRLFADHRKNRISTISAYFFELFWRPALVKPRHGKDLAATDSIRFQLEKRRTQRAMGNPTKSGWPIGPVM
jgi:hypothetical protein